MMKKYIIMVSFEKIAVLVLVLLTTLVNAQVDLPDAPDDTVVVPIDDYVWVLGLIGLFYVFLRIRAYAKQANTSIK